MSMSASVWIMSGPPRMSRCARNSFCHKYSIRAGFSPSSKAKSDSVRTLAGRGSTAFDVAPAGDAVIGRDTDKKDRADPPGPQARDADSGGAIRHLRRGISLGARDVGEQCQSSGDGALGARPLTPRQIDTLRLLHSWLPPEEITHRRSRRKDYSARRKNTRSRFSLAVNCSCRIRLKNSTVSSRVGSRPSWK
jgi:hypothetical protein